MCQSGTSYESSCHCVNAKQTFKTGKEETTCNNVIQHIPLLTIFSPVIHTQRRVHDLLNFLNYASEDTDSSRELTLSTKASQTPGNILSPDHEGTLSQTLPRSQTCDQTLHVKDMLLGFIPNKPVFWGTTISFPLLSDGC